MHASPDSIVFARFLNLLAALRDDPEHPVIDPHEQELLNMIMRRWADGRSLTVLEVMNSGVAGMSPSTVHRRLKRMLRDDLIVHQNDELDSRTKYLVPTDRARRLYDRMADCLQRSCQA